jgi:hypothetical protein
MHHVLERQLKRLFGSLENVPSSIEGLIDTVSKTYEDFYKDRDLIEHSLDVSSKELTAMNLKLKKEKLDIEKTVMKRTEELQEQIDLMTHFQKITTGRELKMIELKEEIERLEKCETMQEEKNKK